MYSSKRILPHAVWSKHFFECDIQLEIQDGCDILVGEQIGVSFLNMKLEHMKKQKQKND